MLFPVKTRVEVRRGKVRITHFARANRGALYVLDSMDFDSSSIANVLASAQAVEFLGQGRLPFDDVPVG
jgi:ferric-dicitrate binding protein FerR (iron transport regulator)